MNSFTKYIPRILKKVLKRPYLWLKIALKPNRYPYPAYLPAKTTVKHGRVLLSYLAEPVLKPEASNEFLYHSNRWECRQIAHLFAELGYDVDVINFDDFNFIPHHRYDVVLDIYVNLKRLLPYFDSQTIKILHATGSDPFYQNAAEQARVDAVNIRRSSHCTTKRTVAFPQESRQALEVADSASLIGNPHTLSTYPQHLQPKITSVTVSASYVGKGKKKRADFVPEKREFLWYFGYGAIHKGLDLLLEVFSNNPQWTLNIIGYASTEKDFVEVYEKELYNLPNIRYHGELRADSDAFRKILTNVFCVIAPSCSEGISPALATLLQIGVYPLISRDTGITLPEGRGTYLETCTISEIIEKISYVLEISREKLTEDIAAIQTYASEIYSRENFRKMMSEFISDAVKLNQT